MVKPFHILLLYSAVSFFSFPSHADEMKLPSRPEPSIAKDCAPGLALLFTLLGSDGGSQSHSASSLQNFVETLVDQVLIPAFQKFNIRQDQTLDLLKDPLRGSLKSLHGTEVGAIGPLLSSIQAAVLSKSEATQRAFLEYFRAKISAFFEEVASSRSKPSNTIAAQSRIHSNRKLSTNVRAFAQDPQGRLLAVSHNFSPVEIIDLESGRMVKSLKESGSGIDGMAFSPNGNLLAVGAWFDNGRMSEVHIYDTHTWTIVQKFELPWRLARFFKMAYMIRSIEFHPDGDSLFIGYSDGVFIRRNLEDGRILSRLGRSRSSVLYNLSLGEIHDPLHFSLSHDGSMAAFRSRSAPNQQKSSDLWISQTSISRSLGVWPHFGQRHALFSRNSALFGRLSTRGEIMIYDSSSLSPYSKVLVKIDAYDFENFTFSPKRNLVAAYFSVLPHPGKILIYELSNRDTERWTSKDIGQIRVPIPDLSLRATRLPLRFEFTSDEASLLMQQENGDLFDRVIEYY